jgi:hypothetical protein
MRLAIAGLAAVFLFAFQTAEAANRSDGRAQAKPAQQTRSTTAATPPRQSATQTSRNQASRKATAGASSRQAQARMAMPAPYARSSSGSLRQTAMASCTTRKGRRSCGPVLRTASLGWSGGMPPMSMAQSTCPDGTMAVNATGHSDVVRCVPL